MSAIAFGAVKKFRPQTLVSESKPQTLDAGTRAFVQLSFMSHRPVKSFEEARTLLKDVAAAHDEVLRNGSSQQIYRIAELTRNGTKYFALAIHDRQKMRQLLRAGNGSN